jgi:hypothetical protein
MVPSENNVLVLFLIVINIGQGQVNILEVYMVQGVDLVCLKNQPKCRWY